jgi:mannosyltransferase OCH1-like enzyme
MIPKIIHQTFPVPDFGPNITKNVKSLQVRNPGWEYRFYDDVAIREFIVAHYDQTVVSAYDLINPEYGPARADLFRYLVIYKMGGVYLDIKSSIDKPLDAVLQPSDEYLLSQWPLGVGGRYWELKHILNGEFQQWHVIARAGHPFLKSVIDAVIANIYCYESSIGIGKIGVLRTTGPIAYTLAIHPLLSQHPHRFVSGRELGMTYNVLSSTGYGQGHRSIFKKHYTTLTTPVVVNIPESSNVGNSPLKRDNVGSIPTSGTNFIRKIWSLLV